MHIQVANMVIELNLSQILVHLKVYNHLSEFSPGKPVVMTTGTFDGVHIGHKVILSHVVKTAHEEGAESVLFTFDPHPRTVLFPEDHGLKLLNSREEKIHHLKEQGIDHVIFHPFSMDFARLTALEYVRKVLVEGIGVNRMIIGYDHRFGRNREGNFSKLVEFSEMFGFAVEEIPAQDIDNVNVSSTKIRKALESGDMKTANSYLGYNYSAHGIVIEGDGIGRTIGFPTANIQVSDPLKLIPGNGVYAVQVKVEGETYPGMLNSGVRPTVSQTGKNQIEVHLIDTQQTLYGKPIEVTFIGRLRSESKFDSKEALIDQLKKDRSDALKMLQ